jgi:23S rRNA (adenine2503-C2)-methyltransferase
MSIDLKGLDALETEDWATKQGLKAFQGRQIRQWLFKKRVGSFDEMTNLSKPLRARLKEEITINHLETVDVLTSEDGTEKFLFQLFDGHFIESVLIPETDHSTLCISSQAGCAMGCLFCSTARQGLKRNLKASEIIDQVIQVSRAMDVPDRLTNIVLMGMGEPLANYDAVLKAVGNLINPDGMNFSNRKVTLSTCGLVPQIKKLGRDITANLAISLNAADDETRSFLMPVNQKYPLKHLISACRDFPLPNRRMITFEYILINDINDRPQDAQKLKGLLSGLRAKINLIPLNAHPDADMTAPPVEKVHQFQEILVKDHFTAIIRKSRGSDILAACGQLSGSYKR